MKFIILGLLKLPLVKHLFLLLFAGLSIVANAQSKLQPGFDGREYATLLSLAYYSSSISDSLKKAGAKDPYRMDYRGQEIGLKNRWTFYMREDNVGVIDLRGTVNALPSWLANFYAAMIPATGRLQLNDTLFFDYQLAVNSRATVHAGWTIALGFLAPDIVRQINASYTKNNTREFLVFGHSQGGALAFLLRSYLEYERIKGHVPPDIVLKTYCSAAPKPGNLYYAYDFDFITRNGWAFTVVNALDWVPETPFSIQTLDDFNQPNPFNNIKPYLRKQKFLLRMAGNSVYGKLKRKPRKAQKKFEKYMGRTMYKHAVKRVLPDLKEPAYAHDNNYARAGVPIVLQPNEAYLRKFGPGRNQMFVHHTYDAYYTLVSDYYFSR